MGRLNQFKILILLVILIAIFLILGSYFGPGGVVIGLILAIVVDMGIYFVYRKK
ncbi:MAG: hypothetical protein ABIB47_00910 [Candidatus Woesearchaeota archaeon]